MTLPPAFGSAYVGEIFSCTLCLNSEISDAEGDASISAIRVAAEMQTPSQTVALELNPAGPESESQGGSLQPGQTMQKIVRFDLKEQGSHVLAITVTYTETVMSRPDGSTAGSQASSGRVRTFRKLYQFVAQQCLAVRTKTVELSRAKGSVSRPPRGAEAAGPRLLLEAQLENMSQELMTLEVRRR